MQIPFVEQQIFHRHECGKVRVDGIQLDRNVRLFTNIMDGLCKRIQ